MPINGSDKTALQLAEDKGFLKPVKCLLNCGTTTSLLDADGNLFSVPEYGSVWSEILSHRQRHTDLIMNLIEKDSKPNLEDNSDNDFGVPDTDSVRTDSQEGRSKPSSNYRSSSVTNASIYTQLFYSETPSTINLEKVHCRFEAMKLDLHKNSHQEQTS
ncbi:unnamed protein product [Mytilus edulis]|uniref:Uncharacterized protein n=1 Tax=Mytilus edulis TaxID=6550 RepID=A0A8S3T3G0_MYTED|nr:unnamed protein product [Mytilus edulis]